MPRTEAVVNNLGPEVVAPVPSGKLLVFLVLKPSAFIQEASRGTVAVPEA